MPATADRPPRELRDQLRRLAELLATEPTLATWEADRELGLDPPAEPSPARPAGVPVGAGPGVAR